MGKKTHQRLEPESFAFQAVGADSHAHLTSAELFNNLEQHIERAIRCGVRAIGNVFLGPEEYNLYKDAFVPFGDTVFFIMGVHPCDAAKFTEKEAAMMERIFTQSHEIKAVGEIGLDFYWEKNAQKIQESVFFRQLMIAKKYKLPVVIHSRDAAKDTIRILEDEGFINYPILWHCFSGDAVQFIDRILANNWYVSVSGAITYPSSEELRDVVQSVPSNRLLLETDSPYLTPVPWRGHNNAPAFVTFTAAAVATLRKDDANELWEICGRNTQHFFRL